MCFRLHYCGKGSIWQKEGTVRRDYLSLAFPLCISWCQVVFPSFFQNKTFKRVFFPIIFPGKSSKGNFQPQIRWLSSTVFYNSSTIM